MRWSIPQTLRDPESACSSHDPERMPTGRGASARCTGKKYMGIVRSAFVIDEHGRIVDAIYKVSPKDTVPTALKALA